MPSPLLAELASAAAEAENLAAENFTFGGSTFKGVLGVAPLNMVLAVTGYAETAEATLQASLAQFSGSPPTNADAANRATITLANGRAWKLVSVDNDGLHVKLGLHLA